MVGVLFKGFLYGQIVDLPDFIIAFVFSLMVVFCGALFTMVPAVIAEILVVKMSLRFGKSGQASGAAL